MFTKLNLSLKFTLVMGLVLICSILLSGALLNHINERRAEEEVTAKALILMETMNSVRNYTSTQVNPLLAAQLETQAEFIPETVPAYSAREVFENLRTTKDYEKYFYKEATLNPTNLRDRADRFETELVQSFRQNSKLKEQHGLRNISGEKIFYVARPLVITKESCLRCHSTPDAAPKSLLATYGAENGFGWNLNEIIAAQTIYIPAEEAFAEYKHQSLLTIQIVTGLFLITVFLINWLLKKMVIQPIIPMARLAQKIGSYETEMDSDSVPEMELKKLDDVAQRYDELGQLARVFRQMANVVYSREQSFFQKLQQLRSETDKAKRAAVLTQVTETDYLQQLLKKARRARSKAEEYKKLNVADLLRKVSYFRNFSDREIQQLVESGYRKIYYPGEYVCREDEPGDAFYIILEGSVEIFVEKINKFLTNLTSGAFFGELSLLLGIPRTATVRTREDTVLFVLDRNGLQKLLSEYQVLAERIIEDLNEHKAELESRKDMLHKMGLIDDEDRENFAQNCSRWIRDRMKNLFGI